MLLLGLYGAMLANQPYGASLAHYSNDVPIECLDSDDPVLVNRYLDGNWQSSKAWRSCQYLYLEGDCNATAFPLSAVLCPRSCSACAENERRHLKGLLVAQNAHAPKRFVIDLDKPEDQRYTEMVHHFTIPLKTAVSLIRKKENWNSLNPTSMIDKIITHNILPELKKELEGFAILLGKVDGIQVTWKDIILLNLYIEFLAGSEGTGVIAKDNSNMLYHAFNFDWPKNSNRAMDDALTALICERQYVRNKRPIIVAVGFAGEIGISRGLRIDTPGDGFKGSWSVEINHRRLIYFADTVFSLTQLSNSSHVSLAFFMREIMEKHALNYKTAIDTLEKYKVASHAYLLIAGDGYMESSLVTLAARGKKVEQLDMRAEDWFLVQSNDDPRTLEQSEGRNASAAFFMRKFLERDYVNDKNMLQLLSTAPVLNAQTRFTAVMTPATGSMAANIVGLYKPPAEVRSMELELERVGAAEELTQAKSRSSTVSAIIFCVLAVAGIAAAVAFAAVNSLKRQGGRHGKQRAMAATWAAFIDGTKNQKEGYQSIASPTVDASNGSGGGSVFDSFDSFFSTGASASSSAVRAEDGDDGDGDDAEMASTTGAGRYSAGGNSDRMALKVKSAGAEEDDDDEGDLNI